MPIIRRTRVSTAAYGVLHWLWWLWLCGAGMRAMWTVKITIRTETFTVHTARVQAPHNHSHHNQCRTPYAAVHTLVLLMMGIMMPETCWDKSLVINIRLVASCWFLSFHPTVKMHSHKSIKDKTQCLSRNVGIISRILASSYCKVRGWLYHSLSPPHPKNNYHKDSSLELQGAMILESFTVYLKNLCLMIFCALTAHQTPTVRAKKYPRSMVCRNWLKIYGAATSANLDVYNPFNGNHASSEKNTNSGARNPLTTDNWSHLQKRRLALQSRGKICCKALL